MFNNRDLDKLIARADAYLARLDAISADDIERAVDEAFLKVCGRTYRPDEPTPEPVAAPPPVVTMKRDAHSNGDGHGQTLSLEQLRKDFPSLFGPDAA